MILTLMLAALAIAAEGAPADAAPPAWKLVSADGGVIIMYVQPDRARDKKVYAEAVAWVFAKLGDQGPFQVDFFDDEKNTPQTRQYTAENQACHRARYNFNPKNGMRRFLWIGPIDPADGKRHATEDTLPLPEDAGAPSSKERKKE